MSILPLNRVRNHCLVLCTAVAVIVAWLPQSAVAGSEIRYVDADAPDGGDGQSWATAYNELEDAASEAGSMPGVINEIWVAEGTYYPRYLEYTGEDRSATLFLVNDCAFLGGFTGNETSADQRDPEVHVTVVSGDIGVPGDPSDNSWNIIDAPNSIGSSAIVDGFTIRDGYADTADDRGGAVHGGGSPVFLNCTFMNNFAAFGGGAVYGGTPEFVNCLFENNVTDGDGGAVLASGTYTECTFRNNIAGSSAGASTSGTYVDCVFESNVSEGFGGAVRGTVSMRQCVFVDNETTFNRGGAIYVNDAYVVDCTFVNNTAFDRAGAIEIDDQEDVVIMNCVFFGNSSSEGGAISVRADDPTITNCVFSGNNADIGGAIRLRGARLTLNNCTILNNNATNEGGGLYTASSQEVFVNNCIVRGNTDSSGSGLASQLGTSSAISINHSNIQDLGGAGTASIDAAPLFVNAVGPDLVPGTEDDDLRLLPMSPCIDAAQNSSVPADYFDADDDGDTGEPVPFDVYGGVRFYDDPNTTDTGSGTPPIVDMGAHEFDETTGDGGPQPGEYVGPTGGDWFNPANWGDGNVPDANTNVLVSDTVVVSQLGAVADVVRVENGGDVQVLNGSVAANEIVVQLGGALTIDHTAALVDVGDMTVESGGSLNWSHGTVQLTGTWTQPDGVMIGCSGNATLQLEPGCNILSSTVQLCMSGEILGGGFIDADVLNAGRIAPGNSTNVVQIDGNYNQESNGTLDIELDGYIPGLGYDQLAISGIATLSGSVDVTLLGTFQPQLANRHLFLTAESISGTFDAINLPALPGSFLFETEYHDVQNLSDDQTAVRLLTALASTNSRIYVNAAASSGGDGQTWATATRNVQSALSLAREFPSSVREVWVASGTYTPDFGTGDRSATFEVFVSGFAVYGGFAGGETSIDQRAPSTNITVLSGDLEEDDGPSFANRDDNAYHVITLKQSGACILPGDMCVDGLTPIECTQMGGISEGYGTLCDTKNVSDPVIDGFTISGGQADRPDKSNDRSGAGILSQVPNLQIANCRFTSNYSDFDGTCIRDESVDVHISNCRFDNNLTLNSLYWGGGGGSPTFEDCAFESNEGAAVKIPGTAAAHLERCVFDGNTESAGSAGALLLEGQSGSETTSVIDCDFFENVRMIGGAAIHHDNDADLIVDECNFIGNVGGAIESGNGLLISNSTFDGNSEEHALLVHAPDGNVAATIINCDFMDNSNTFQGGAALWVASGIAEITNCNFTSNSTTELGGAVYLSGTAELVIDNCTFQGNTGAQGNACYIRPLARLTGNGIFLGNDGIFNGGFLSPGIDSTGTQFDTMVIEGGFTQGEVDITNAVTSRLQLDIGEDSGMLQHDFIDASQGAVTFNGGALEIRTVSPYFATEGDQFQVLTAASITGGFDVVSMPQAPAGLFVDATFDNESLVLTIDSLATILTFGVPQQYPLSGVPQDAAFADMDNDGDLDAVAVIPDPDNPGSSNGTLAVLRSAGTDSMGNWLGFSSPPITISTDVNPSAVAVAHLSGDAFLDVAVVNAVSDTMNVYYNNATGDASLSLDQTYAVAEFPVRIIAGNSPLQQAGNLIVASLDPDRNVTQFVNDGTGVFTAGQAIEDTISALDLELADVDDDGNKDLIVLRRDLFGPAARGRVITRLYNTGSQTYGAANTTIAGIGTTSLAIADFNLDTSLDVAAVNPDEGTISILINSAIGDGLFGASNAIQVGNLSRSIVAGDLDLDGDQDLALLAEQLSGDSVLRIVRNDMNGGSQLIFAPATGLGTGGTPNLAFVTDIDSNQLPDLLVINDETQTRVSRGSGVPSLGVLINETDATICPADIADGDHVVNVFDLLELLAQWGTNGNGSDLADPVDIVNVFDLLELLAAWGACG